MSEEKKLNKVVNPPISEINANTNVVFTVKTFLALMGLIFGIFLGFYRLVIAPTQVELKVNQVQMKNEINENYKFMYTEFGKINQKLNDMNSLNENNYRENENEKYTKRNKTTGRILNPNSLPYKDTIINKIRYTYPLNENSSAVIKDDYFARRFN